MATHNYLITGGAGYVGAELTDLLLKNGHYVKVVDTFYFETHFEENKNLKISKKDVRNLEVFDFKNIDIVIDLASISNDPSGELNPYLTYKINGESRGRTASLAKKAGVKGYILASSCSVYGFNDKLVDEKSSTNPLTTYAYANLLAEKLVKSLADSNFSVIIFRQATLFGSSKRMRTDLVVNGMTYSGLKNGKIDILRNGEQKRPLLSLNELNNRFLSINEEVFKKQNKQIFNIGNKNLNLEINSIYDIVNRVLGGELEKNWYGEADYRSYEVDFSKAENSLPKIEKTDIELEIINIKNTFSEENFDYSKSNTLGWYQGLIDKNPEMLFSKSLR